MVGASASTTSAEAIVRITTSDGHEFSLACLDGHDPNTPILLCWPAMGTQARSYRTFAEAMSERGFTTAVGELRGHGSSSLRASHRCNFGFREMLQNDWPAALEAVSQRYPGRPVYLLGHSLGGQLSLLYTAAHPDQVSGVIIVASCSTYYRNYGLRGLALFGLLLMVPPLVKVVGHFPGTRLGFARNEGRRVARDWAAQGRTGAYRPSGDPTQYEKLLTQLRLPVYALEIEGDHLATPPAVTHLLSKLKQAQPQRKMVTLPEPRPGKEHFDWLRQPTVVADQLSDWLLKK